MYRFDQEVGRQFFIFNNSLPIRLMGLIFEDLLNNIQIGFVFAAIRSYLCQGYIVKISSAYVHWLETQRPPPPPPP